FSAFILILLVPLAALFYGARLPVGNALPPPGTPLSPVGPVVMIFSALPWILAAGILGPVPGAILATLSGGLIVMFDGHNPFIPLLYGFMALLFGIAIRQRFRTLSYRILNRPLVSGLGISLIYPIGYLLTTLFILQDSFPLRLDYVLSRVDTAAFAFAIQVIAAASIAELGVIVFPKLWGHTQPLVPSPGERSLEGRIRFSMGSFVIALVVSLTLGIWVVAGNASKKMLQDRMANTAHAAAQHVPFALEAGQNLITQLGQDRRLYSLPPEEIGPVLVEYLRELPYFHQLSFLDAQGNSLAGFPVMEFQSIFPTPEENRGIQLAMQGVNFQSYSLPPGAADTSAGLSFVVVVEDTRGRRRGILVGRTKLDANPFTLPIIDSLTTMRDVEGEGILLDEQDVILYHPESNLVGTKYDGKIPDSAEYYSDSAADGTRQMVYAAPVQGRQWVVITSVPARVAQQAAMDIAVPLLVILGIIGISAYVILIFWTRLLSGSLQRLAVESGRIAEGNLDHSLELKSADEIGQLGRSFEQMRVSLKNRLEEINRLLFVSQGVASAIEMDTAVQPILEGAMAIGPSSARVVLAQTNALDMNVNMPTRFGLGELTDEYADLDNQILGLTQKQDKVILTNPARAGLEPANDFPPPATLMAVALKHENVYYGALWLAYEQPRKFNQEEARFISTIASQAALAAANARLYTSAQMGRQRLEAILASTPDPVLVTDHRGRVLLVNPAAVNLLQNGPVITSGTPVESFIQQEELIALINSLEDQPQSAEVSFPGNRIFNATASPVLADGQLMGRVCVLTDITQFKELDALKTEFVSTVSHDLRSPLTLMRGYATMLQMVGELNEQQIGYVEKIVSGVENMSRLVNNLLDLGRIEAGIGLRPEMVDVTETVTQVTEGLQIQAAQKQINLTTNFPQKEIPAVEADPALLQQAFYNLVENAIKYTDRDGEITVSLAVEKGVLVFTVIDNGIGVAPVDQPRLFDRFFRVDQKQSNPQSGSGMGLAIVKSIAERHGGGVGVESQLGQGSTFHLTIPLRQPK
ncbi:MAG: ATP-binding protein, partial [Anaerolineae bacterium]|nr:ATP-binding protein [Anaerolineae bacterium]